MANQPTQQINPQINGLVDYLYGREAQGGDVGTVALFVQAHVRYRPAAGTNSRWPDVDAMKTHAFQYGPSCTPAQIDTALAAAGLS